MRLGGSIQKSAELDFFFFFQIQEPLTQDKMGAEVYTISKDD